MDAERLERAARALLEHRDARMAALKATEDEDRPDARGFAWGALTSAESREEAAAVALRAALDAAQEPAPATGAVADAAIKAKAQGFDRICLRCLCGFSRTDECPRCQPTGSAQAGEAVAWQIVDHNYGPTHYFGMTEDDAWARMVKASGEGRSVWARTRFARPLYAAPSRPGGASRAAALKEAEEACRKVARDAAENGLSKPFNFVDGAYHAAEAVHALAGRGA